MDQISSDSLFLYDTSSHFENEQPTMDFEWHLHRREHSSLFNASFDLDLNTGKGLPAPMKFETTSGTIPFIHVSDALKRDTVKPRKKLLS